MINLDNVQSYRQLDSSDMLRHLHNFSEQCEQTWQNALRFKLPESYRTVNKIIILGMGGSAIGGDIVKRLSILENRLPVWVHRDYGLPPFIDADTLVIASSYSGNTEETLDAFTRSLRFPAKKLVITTGGELKTIAERESIPVLRIDYQSPPRAALPNSFFSLLGLVHKLSLLSDKSQEVLEAFNELKNIAVKLNEGVPLNSNPAKQLAKTLSGKIPVVYGAEFLSEVAQRWKTQLNENSKSWAFHEIFSELNHNSIVGYEFPNDLKEKMFVVLLRSPLFNERISERYRLTANIMSKSGIAFQTIDAVGNLPLTQIMSLVLYGDYVSFYLALLNNVDPSSIAAIDYLKSNLAKS